MASPPGTWASPLPLWFTSEALAQSRLTLPLSLTLLTRFVLGFVDLVVIGRLLGAQSLAGAALALTLQFTTLGVITGGCGDAVASLCSQALGAGQPALCGLWLQAGMLCSSAAFLALSPLWWYAGDILAAAGAEAGAAALGALYARASLGRGIIHVNYYCFKVFLLAQGRPALDIAACLLGLVAGVLLDIVLVGGTCALGAGGGGGGGACWQGLGFVGAPVAATATRGLTAATLLALGYGGWGWSGDVRGAAPCWTGWALHSGPAGALRRDRLAAFAALALPASARAAVDQGVMCSLSLMAAGMGTASAGAHNACVELYAVVGGAAAWAGCDGVLLRVGRALGAGDAPAARRAAAVGVLLALGYALLLPPALLLLPPAGAVGGLFSSDAEVLRVTTATLPPMAALIVATALVFALLGAALGSGHASFAGTVWLAAGAASVPAAYAWGVSAHGGVPALWGALTLGYMAAAVALAARLGTADWQRAAEEAASRQAAAAAEGKEAERGVEAGTYEQLPGS